MGQGFRRGPGRRGRAAPGGGYADRRRAPLPPIAASILATSGVGPAGGAVAAPELAAGTGRGVPGGTGAAVGARATAAICDTASRLRRGRRALPPSVGPPPGAGP